MDVFWSAIRNKVRSNSGVGDVGRAMLGSIICNTEDDASDVVDEGSVFSVQTFFFKETEATTTSKEATEGKVKF